MSLENPLANTPPLEDASEQEVKAEAKIKSRNKLGGLINKVKKTAALAGVVGVGYFGSMGSGEAADASLLENTPNTKHEEVTESSAGKTMEASELFEVLYKETKITWGVEYVKKSKEGRNFLAQRYVKIDDATGVVTILGEFDNVIEASKGLAKVADVPEQIVKHAQHEAGAVEMERSFQASGFTEPTGDASGKTHVEERHFKGNGIDATNTVEVDEKGKVVRLIDSKF